MNSNSPTSESCAALFNNARSSGATGAMPVDTATAAINIARNPRTNIAALYALQAKSAKPFAPALDEAPSDFTLSLVPNEAKQTVASLEQHPVIPSK